MLEDQGEPSGSGLENDRNVSLMGRCVDLLKRTELNSQEVDIRKEIGAGKGVFLVVRRGVYPPENSQAVLMFLSSEAETKLKVDYLVVKANAPLNSKNVTSLEQSDLTERLFGGQFSLDKKLNGIFLIGYRETHGIPSWNKLRSSTEGRFGGVERDLEIRGIDPRIEKEIFSMDHTDESILAVLPVEISKIAEKKGSDVLTFPSRVEQKVAA